MKDSLKTAYEEIWEKYRSTSLNTLTGTHQMPLLDRGFVFQFDEDEAECDLLFVGINPSFGEDAGSHRGTYTKNDVDHAYFKPFQQITGELAKTYKQNIRWSHIDLLVFRETDQSYIRKHLFKLPEGIGFIVDQLEISKKKLEFFRPKVIVVANTMAKELLGRNRGIENGKEYGVWMGYHFEFDQTIGTDVITTEGPLKGTKVFFTSMLSGQRALDNGSKERLIWHIARTLNADNKSALP
jgi:hypothetical protein